MASRKTLALTLLTLCTLPLTSACSSADISTLGPLGADAATPIDQPTVPIDQPTVPIDQPTVPIDQPTVPIDQPTVPIDQPTVPIDQPTVPIDQPTVPIDQPTVEVGPPLADRPVPPVDVPSCPLCRAAPAFCDNGSHSSLCTGVEFCTDGCPRCVTPALTGDTCESAPIFDTRGTTLHALTTCGAEDNLSVGCDREGIDLVLGFRVAMRGRVVQRFWAPAGVTLNVAFRGRNEPCRNQASSSRDSPECFNRSPSQSVTLDRTLDPGIYYVYLLTSRPATVILQSILP